MFPYKNLIVLILILHNFYLADQWTKLNYRPMNKVCEALVENRIEFFSVDSLSVSCAFHKSGQSKKEFHNVWLGDQKPGPYNNVAIIMFSAFELCLSYFEHLRFWKCSTSGLAWIILYDLFFPTYVDRNFNNY